MAINSKKKGNKNERHLAKLWQKWTGWEFTRVPASGGLRWKKTDNITGDIICSEPGIIFAFCIEAKSRKELDFQNLINGNNCEVLKFWQQAKDDSIRANKIPLLFMRYNGMKKDMHYVGMEWTLYHKLKNVIDISHGRIRYNKGKVKLVFINSRDWFNADFQILNSLV